MRLAARSALFLWGQAGTTAGGCVGFQCGQRELTGQARWVPREPRGENISVGCRRCCCCFPPEADGGKKSKELAGNLGLLPRDIL